MKHKQFWTGVMASLGMIILILDGQTALEGAQTGVELCLTTVIPCLFPFFLLSNLLTKSFTGMSVSILRPLGHLCKFPEGAESIFLSGFLGGYPVGAQCICDAYHAGQLDKKDAERMLAFCNNAGPAFLFGMVSRMFPGNWFIWGLWTIHIVSAIFTAVILPGRNSRILSTSEKSGISLSVALQSALRVMAAVCGWVILFRVLIAFLERWIFWLLPIEWKVLLTGLLELSNGCCELESVSDLSIRFVICSCILAFGGSCVSLQTLSVTKGLSLRPYFKGKLLQTLFSFIISLAVVHHKTFPVLLILLLFLYILQKTQKKSSIPAAVGV